MEEEVTGLTREEKQWLAWFVVTLGTFVYLEARAVKARNGRGTLTAATRRVLGLYPPKPWRLFGAAGFIAFFAWLTAHMITRSEERRVGKECKSVRPRSDRNNIAQERG